MSAKSGGAGSAKDQASDQSQSSQARKKKKRKTKAQRSEAPMNLQLQQSWIDPATGDTVYMDMGGNMTGWLDANTANQGAGPGAGHHQSPYGVGAAGGHPQAHGGFMDHQSSTVQLQLEQQLQKMMSTVPLQLQM